MSEADKRLTALIRFLHRVNRLKFEHRAGWLDRGVPPDETESVADHSWRAALIAWLVSGSLPELDQLKVIKLALLHDLAEAVTGDMTPYDPAGLDSLPESDRRAVLNLRQVPSTERKASKHLAEQQAIDELLADIPEAMRREISGLWQEMEQRMSPEARLVKEIDIFETWLQSREYLGAYPGSPMESFALEARERLTTPALRRMLQARLAIEAEEQN